MMSGQPDSLLSCMQERRQDSPHSCRHSWQTAGHPTSGTDCLPANQSSLRRAINPAGQHAGNTACQLAGTALRKLRDADAMLMAGKDLAAILQALEVSEATYHRWRNQYGGMKSEEAKWLKLLEDENRRLRQLVADLLLDNQMLKHVASGNPRGGPCWVAVDCSAIPTGCTRG